MMMLERRPFFFGPDERSLFGWYHAPTTGARGDLAVVVCPPLGHEYINSHRAMRHLTDAIARAGIPALRFDYDGTGDSAGSDEDPGRIQAWLRSIHAAVEMLRALSGCTRIVLAGARAGATLAACAAAEMDVEGLVLWIPVVRGRAYLRELKALQLTGATRDSPDFEPAGFVYADETRRDLNAINLEQTLPKTSRVLIVVRDDMPQETKLADSWRAAGIDVQQIAAPGYNEMYGPPHESIVPQEAIGAIVQWLQTLVTGDAIAPSTMQPRTAHYFEGVRESVLQFGASYFGILSEPQTGAHGPTVVLNNGGATHHVGPNRVYIDLSRALSRAGFRVLRYDLPGLGDSIIDDLARENDCYLPETTDVVARTLQTLNAPQVIVAGLCSGAHASLHAAIRIDNPALIESVLINPLTYYYKPGMSLSDSPAEHHSEWQRYRAEISTLTGWKKVLRGKVRPAGIVRTIFRRMRDYARSRINALRGQDDNLARDIRRITQSGRKLTFVFSRSDPGYDMLMLAAASVVKRMRKAGAVELWRVDNASHTFEARASRAVMIDTLTRHLVERYQGTRR